MVVKIYVEGGGGSDALKTECRKGFAKFFKKAGMQRQRLSVIACGSRREAFEDFCTELSRNERGKFICLLVDSEGAVAANTSPWTFLVATDRWRRPQRAADESAHLMVQCMESWFLADVPSLKAYFGQGFRARAFAKRRDIENIAKADVYDRIKRATRDCVTKGAYRKGKHSFEILGIISAEAVATASPYAQRLLKTLKRKTNE